jgi:hypothetical protein
MKKEYIERMCEQCDCLVWRRREKRKEKKRKEREQ